MPKKDSDSCPAILHFCELLTRANPYIRDGCSYYHLMRWRNINHARKEIIGFKQIGRISRTE